jgi:hypothetical protein
VRTIKPKIFLRARNLGRFGSGGSSKNMTMKTSEPSVSQQAKWRALRVALLPSRRLGPGDHSWRGFSRSPYNSWATAGCPGEDLKGVSAAHSLENGPAFSDPAHAHRCCLWDQIRSSDQKPHLQANCERPELAVRAARRAQALAYGIPRKSIPESALKGESLGNIRPGESPGVVPDVRAEHDHRLA